MLPQRLLLAIFSLHKFSVATVLPHPYSISDTKQGRSSNASPRVIQPDEVIVFGRNGEHKIMKESEWEELVRQDELFSQQSGPSEDFVSAALNSTANEDTQSVKRDCEKSTELQILDTTYFNNWDVPMSGVIQANGVTPGPGNTISVTDGFQLANAITVGSTTTVTLIAAILQTAVNFQYARTWTTTYTAAYTFTVPKDDYGLVISNPYTRRVSGNTLSGCTGSWNKEYFQADSYFETSQSGLSWVQGVIRLCASSKYPVPYCLGNGVHR
ncbi:hypothetical protein BKA66DRAFT_444872 [Pyrenochaeta sp. MPI-SDFR-AT-0127]|nr:hypothetical protein BKA66DRAFT_444872 [Pyrenochaeta sp. MPI-SDFR-AT-0127]